MQYRCSGRAGLKITQLPPGTLGVGGRSGFATLSTLAVDQARWLIDIAGAAGACTASGRFLQHDGIVSP